MRYMALQGDQGWVLFRWMKRGAIMWCLPRGPKSRSQVFESSWGMLSTWPGEKRASVSRSLLLCCISKLSSNSYCCRSYLLP